MIRTAIGRGGRAVVAAAVVCLVAATAQGAAADPSPGPGTGTGTGAGPARPMSLAEVRDELDRLYHDAEVATDTYNAAEERAGKQSARVAALAEDLAAGKVALKRLTSRMGAAARAQYRSGGLPLDVQLLLSADPDDVLDEVGLARQAQHGIDGLLREQTRIQEELRKKSAAASVQLERLQGSRKAGADARKRIEKRIATAESLELRLEEKERKRLLAMQKKAEGEAHDAFLRSGSLKDVKGRASEEGATAVAFASEQLGKPYDWGAEGPDTYDCSGLTSQAWAAAKRTIPRTSQEQWRLLPRIGIGAMRPGDLIIYHRDASHVGIYIGGGSIIHAPRPGRHVTVADAGSMYILGVVRPDKRP
ncbi:NlpC/P60 family protein [Streptomyces sp. NBC_00234]|uniref:C40 family peptidase n=1 Tax=Streptomyces sp. NBC_00234 TaxID=2903638 RepID=UPI002E2DD3FC|nr:NlpC/P60 family protein [Streptomyces sp. NBC_00234]